MDDPAFLLVFVEEAIEVGEVVAGGFKRIWQCQRTAFVSFPEPLCYGVPPLGHDGITGEVEIFPGIIIGNATTAHGKVHMDIPFQVSAEGVQGGEDTWRNPFFAGNGLYGFGSKGAKGLQQFTIQQKKVPQLTGHGEGDMR